jgi:hypothetical protein
MHHKYIYVAGKPFVERLFPNEMGAFADECCESWDSISDIPMLPAGSDTGANLSNRLRKLIPVVKGRFHTLAGHI